MKITSATSYSMNKPSYPWIGVTKQQGKIVLFTEPKTGVVLHSGTGCDTVGTWFDSWTETSFEPYYEAVTVQMQR